MLPATRMWEIQEILDLGIFAFLWASEGSLGKNWRWGLQGHLGGYWTPLWETTPPPVAPSRLWVWQVHAKWYLFSEECHQKKVGARARTIHVFSDLYSCVKNVPLLIRIWKIWARFRPHNVPYYETSWLQAMSWDLPDHAHSFHFCGISTDRWAAG